MLQKSKSCLIYSIRMPLNHWCIVHWMGVHLPLPSKRSLAKCWAKKAEIKQRLEKTWMSWNARSFCPKLGFRIQNNQNIEPLHMLCFSLFLPHLVRLKFGKNITFLCIWFEILINLQKCSHLKKCCCLNIKKVACLRICYYVHCFQVYILYH